MASIKLFAAFLIFIVLSFLPIASNLNHQKFFNIRKAMKTNNIESSLSQEEVVDSICVEG